MKREEKHRHFINFDIAGFTYWDGAMALCNLRLSRGASGTSGERNHLSEQKQ